MSRPSKPLPAEVQELRAQLRRLGYNIAPIEWPTSAADPLGMGPVGDEDIDAYWERVRSGDETKASFRIDMLRREVFGEPSVAAKAARVRDTLDNPPRLSVETIRLAADWRTA
jgi:hypothetical protein